MELLSKKFLACCYFGQSEDLIKAAIDRAYVDMTSHTLQYNGFKDDEDGIKEKWWCRYNASCVIGDGLKNYPLNNATFDGWHKYIIEKIKHEYGKHDLTEGQAQKWLNMTIKYIFVFANLFGNDYGRLDEINVFLNDTSVDDYKCPIDSYVLKGANMIKPEKNSYAEYCNIRDTIKNVIEEIENSTAK